MDPIKKKIQRDLKNHETPRCPIFGILLSFDHMSSDFSVTRKTETVYISVYIIGTLPHVIDIFAL